MNLFHFSFLMKRYLNLFYTTKEQKDYQTNQSEETAFDNLECSTSPRIMISKNSITKVYKFNHREFSNSNHKTEALVHNRCLALVVWVVGSINYLGELESNKLVYYKF